MHNKGYDVHAPSVARHIAKTLGVRIFNFSEDFLMMMNKIIYDYQNL